MNDSNSKARQQVVDSIKNSTNILVTVSQNPSVDDLSSALGLTAMLNKVDKHVTAIFSGDIPPAISFLDPDKVFENNADSLRDFIIALDKEKADHLRYKIEGDYVKIFITPYRTTINSDDLEFSQGDFNVELVLALGVDSQEHLDKTLASHGKVLDDVNVASLTIGSQTSNLGNIAWHDDSVSSLSEMLVSLSDSLKTDKTLLDKQIATALLTGIVASTDRFSNDKTSSRTMTTAAQLMAAGADQQLIATQLREQHAISSLPNTAVEEDTSVNMSDNLSTLPIEHKNDSKPEASDKELKIDNTKKPQENQVDSEPTLGGTLNATSEQAAEDAKKELADQQNKTILSHSYIKDSDNMPSSTINATGEISNQANTDNFSGAHSNTDSTANDNVNSTPNKEPDLSTLPPISSSAAKQQASPVDNKPAAQSTIPPTPPVPSEGLPMPPSNIPDFSKLSTQPQPPTTNAVMDDLKAMADGSKQTSVEKSQSTLPPTQPQTPSSTNSDPGQFVIPGGK